MKSALLHDLRRDLADKRPCATVTDMASDAQAAKAAGLAGAVHLLTGHGVRQRRDAAALASPDFPVLVARSLGEAHELLAEQGLFG